MKAASRSWPVEIFYNVLDLAAINAQVLFKSVTGRNISRQKFILNLSEELSEKAREKRLQEKVENEELPGLASVKNRKKFQVGQCKGNKTQDQCFRCKKFACGSCTKVVRKYVVCSTCHE